MKNIALLLFTACFILSCSKAGTGGKATINCSVYDAYNRPVNGVTVYIKYGQSTAPSTNTSGYDDNKQASANSNTVVFTGMKQGTYYLFATVYDSLIHTTNNGGAPLSVTFAKRNKTVDATVALTY